MQEVKIYTASPSDLSPPVQSESFCVDMVLASDYAELEAKYAALAADNDKAMEAMKQANEAVKLAHNKFFKLAAENAVLKYQEPTLKAMMACFDAFYADEDVPERAMMAAYNIIRKSINTPATDAFLAEVRAIELDSLAGVAETMLIKFSNQQCSSDMHEVVGWKMILQQAANRAAQLRKGVAQ
ncbi:hypothetical protein GRJ93_002687 [Salmonella enterica]|nr:hypothetical protein [Salmonella enterica]ECE1998753.1 hypothetical protein [Salmonella enterica]ECP0369937.1 hypothetical protein [Salmonella enterica]EDQ8690642.1 hypothetical protein [Salmonella enterica]EGA2678112.1 hypothetical protein [Salmonella enterica]